MMSRRGRSVRRWGGAALAASLVLGSAAPLRAQAPDPVDTASAQALFKEATSLMEAGQYSGALERLESLLRFDPTLTGVLYNKAICLEALGRLASAYETWAQVEAASRGAEEIARKRREKAAERMAELEPRRSTLTVDVVGALRGIAGLEVRREAVNLEVARWGAAVPVDGGTYKITASAPGKVLWEKTVEVPREGGKVVVEVGPLEDDAPAPAASGATAPQPLTKVPVLPAPTVPPASSRGEQGPGAQRIASYVAGGVGLAGLAVGGVLGGLAIERKGVMEGHCGAAIIDKDPNACDGEGLNAWKTAVTLGHGSTVALAVGGVLFAAGMLLLVTAPQPTASGAAGARGGWMSAGVLSAGPAGAVVGARGVW